MTLKNGGGERRKSSHENSAWRQGTGRLRIGLICALRSVLSSKRLVAVSHHHN